MTKFKELSPFCHKRTPKSHSNSPKPVHYNRLRLQQKSPAPAPHHCLVPIRPTHYPRTLPSVHFLFSRSSLPSQPSVCRIQTVTWFYQISLINIIKEENLAPFNMNSLTFKIMYYCKINLDFHHNQYSYNNVVVFGLLKKN